MDSERRRKYRPSPMHSGLDYDIRGISQYMMDSTFECPKCGYLGLPKFNYMGVGGPEYMLLTCSACSYQVKVDCADKESKEK